MKKIVVASILVSSFFVHISAQSNDRRPRQVETQSSNQQNPPGKNQTETIDDGEIVRVNTALVAVPVSVLDRNGRFLTDLRQEDFEIFEDGKKQEVGYFGTTEQPITVVLVLDTSPSTELRIEQIQNAAISFVNQLKPNDRVMVIEFDDKVNVLTEATSDRRRLEKAVRKADFGDGTALYDAIENIVKRRLRDVQGRKAIVIFTDGVDTASHKTDDLASLQTAEQSGVTVYPVYYNTINDHARSAAAQSDEDDPADYRGTTPEEYEFGRRYLLDLATRTGGKIYATAANRSLDAAFAGIAEELRRQYSVGYYPTEAGQTGTRRQITVRINRPGASLVQARDSYIVGGEQPPNASLDKKKSRN